MKELTAPTRPLRIFVTAHSARAGGGILVAKNIISAMGRAAPRNEYFFTVPPDLGFEGSCTLAPRHMMLVYRSPGLLRRWHWEATELVRTMRAFGPDVIFNLGNRGFIKPRAPQATFVHDSHLFYPAREFRGASLRDRLMFFYHRQHLRRSLMATQMVFCQTDVAQRRLVETYGLPYMPEVIANRLSSSWSGEFGDVAMPGDLGGFKDQFKLFVPTRCYAHKNLEVIPRLFERYRDCLKDATFVLTLSDRSKGREARLLRRIRAVASRAGLLAVGPLGQDELRAFYRYTDALFLPTLLESFSLTYLEAMLFERPIITSDRDFAHAICGNAALYVDPLDVASVFKGIQSLMDSKALRDELVAAGRARLARMSCSWDDMGKTIIKALEGIAAHQGP